MNAPAIVRLDLDGSLYVTSPAALQEILNAHMTAEQIARSLANAHHGGAHHRVHRATSAHWLQFDHMTLALVYAGIFYPVDLRNDAPATPAGAAGSDEFCGACQQHRPCSCDDMAADRTNGGAR